MRGSVEPLKELHQRFGTQVEFVEVITRNAHPGPAIPPYESTEEKAHDCALYKDVDSIPWTVLVDDLEGRVHKLYGGLTEPVYLLDAEGRVAHYSVWGSVPALYAAIDKLLSQGGVGTVTPEYSFMPMLMAAATNGWRGLGRGVPQSYLEIEMAAPSAGSLVWLGDKLRPVLAPFTLGARPLPVPVRGALGLEAAALALAVTRRLR